jgi:hypothetical protein
MKSILKHGCGADIYQIIEDLKIFCPEKELVFECVAMLMETGIISFSPQHFDFIFHPDTAISPLVKALKESKMPLIAVEEYVSHGWRKIAGLPLKE